MEGRPSIRVKLMFHDNPHGADPVSTVEGVLTFPGRGHKGVIKPGQLWDCDVVFASHNYVMIAPRIELEDALDTELGVLRYHQGAREVAHLKLNDAMELLRSGQIPTPELTPRPLPKKGPTPPPKPSSPAQPVLRPSTKNAPPGPAPSPVPPVAPHSAAASASSIPAPLHVPLAANPTQERPAQAVASAAVTESRQHILPTPAPSTITTTTSPPIASSSPPAPAAAVVPRTAPASTGAPRSVDEWRRLLDGPDGRAIAELLADRLGISTALPHIEDSIDGQEEILSILRGEAGDIRRSIKDLGAQIEDVRKQTLAWRRKENQDLRGVPKPAPQDPDHPTDDEIEREIVHQLYQKECWGNKYGQYEKLKRGYNSKASDRQVRAAVHRLQEKRWILIYAKDTDQFRLNPARAEDVYRFLGVPDRAAEQLAEDTRGELETPDAVTKRDLAEAMDGVATRTDIERILTPIRQKLNSLEERPTISVPVVEQNSPRNSDLTEVKGILRGLQGELNRIKKLAEDTAAAQRRLEQHVKETAQS